MVLLSLRVQITSYKNNNDLYIFIIEKNPFIIYLFRIQFFFDFMIPKNPMPICWGSLD